MVSVLVVDDSTFMRDIIKDIVNNQPNMEVIAEASNGTEGFEKYKELRPDIVTLDIIMSNENGISALKRILELDPNANIIMITSIGQDKSLKECLDAGAKGFIIKPFTEEQVVATLHDILS